MPPQALDLRREGAAQGRWPQQRGGACGGEAGAAHERGKRDLRPSTVYGLSDAQNGDDLGITSHWQVMPHPTDAPRVWSDARTCIDAIFINNNKSTVAGCR